MSIRAGARRFFQQGDLLLLILCSCASACGLVLIASAAAYRGGGRYVLIQGIAVGIGVAAYILFTCMDLERLTDRWYWLPVFNVLLLAALALWGVDGGTGNRSWLRFSRLPVGIQPAEIVKLTFVLLLARQMARCQQRGIGRPSAALQLALHGLCMCALVLAVSGDAGMALVYAVIFLLMAFLAGVPLYWFAVLGAGIAAAAVFLREQIWSRLPDYIRMRLLVVLDHDLDPLNVGWQQARSLLAIGSGQVTGQGLFHGPLTQSAAESSLPARHTDFIFAVAGEELGLLGCVAILLLLTAIILRCVQTGLTAPDSMSALVCMGFAGMLLCQTVLNVAMCLYLAPVVGLTLPFFSYGGSSVVTLFAAMGMVSGVRFRTPGRRLYPAAEW